MQALWAQAWLERTLPPGAMQPGWTYVFEAAWRGAMRVLAYPFEGLVLLGAVDPTGRELTDPGGLCPPEHNA